MDLYKIIDRIDDVSISEKTTVTQLKHEEDDAPYKVWIINTDNKKYILKEAKDNERELYQSIRSISKESAPALHQVITVGEKTYLLMEYIEGENLCKCNRANLTRVLDSLILLQQKTWESIPVGFLEHSFEKSLVKRENRGKYLNDSLLEKAYGKFLTVYQSVPQTLCHDDLLPFNVICSDQRAVLIDWEHCGILPYPTSLARLIAHVEDNTNALFYMTQDDRDFAIEYYYENLLKEKGISYLEWRNTLEYFLFYEYCEWVFVGNKYNVTDGEYYKKYLPIAKRQATKILKLEI